MSRFRTGSHWGRTIICEGVQPADRSGRRPDDELIAVVVNGDVMLAERIVRGLHLLALSESLVPRAEPCAVETWSWEHFNDQQTDGYWITCDVRGPHDVHEDQHTGLTWRSEAGPS